MDIFSVIAKIKFIKIQVIFVNVLQNIQKKSKVTK
jgi:hypothetical protein